MKTTFPDATRSAIRNKSPVLTFVSAAVAHGCCGATPGSGEAAVGPGLTGGVSTVEPGVAAAAGVVAAAGGSAAPGAAGPGGAGGPGDAEAAGLGAAVLAPAGVAAAPGVAAGTRVTAPERGGEAGPAWLCPVSDPPHAATPSAITATATTSRLASPPFAFGP